jgi:hypothetical protein
MSTDRTHSSREWGEILEAVRFMFAALNEQRASGKPRFILRTTSGIKVEVFFHPIFFDEELRRKLCAGWEWPPMLTTWCAERDLPKAELHELDAWVVGMVSSWSQHTGQKVTLPSAAGGDFYDIDGSTITRTKSIKRESPSPSADS